LTDFSDCFTDTNNDNDNLTIPIGCALLAELMGPVWNSMKQ